MEALLVAVDLLIALTGVPLVLQIVPKNRWYGMRTRRTLSGTSAEWYAANRRAGYAMVAAGGISLLLTALLRILGPLGPKQVLAMFLVLPALLIVAALVAFSGRQQARRNGHGTS